MTDIILSIRDYLLERMIDRENVQHDYNYVSESDSIGYCIWWSELVRSPELSLQYTITLMDGYATLACYDLFLRVFDYADPEFPDNLLKALPVLTLSDGTALPQRDAITPDSGEI